MHAVSNEEIARVLKEISVYLDMQDVPFKPRAYEKVADVVANLENPLAEVYKNGGIKALQKIPGVGASIAETIEELLKTGHSKHYEELKKKIPVVLTDFVGIEGLGPKKIKQLYQKLGVKNLADLERAVAAHKVSGLEGFGKKSEENIAKGIEFVKGFGGRFTLGCCFYLWRSLPFPGILPIIGLGIFSVKK